MLLITSTANIKTWERDNGLYGGLSPLARGTRQNGLSSLVRLRFIPAGAGNTCFRKSMDYCYSVYPRWRGEHEMLVSVNAANTGLSPLARGTHILQNTRLISTRFIPAGAGNTCCSSWWSAAIAVYPRWRGEHNVRLSPLCVVAGLSPLARGTLAPARRPESWFRFIPAGAGNTTWSPIVGYTVTVYPRWRGEHITNEGAFRWHAGLSPLARGTL